jgi:hypothetical protein
MNIGCKPVNASFEALLRKAPQDEGVSDGIYEASSS